MQYQFTVNEKDALLNQPEMLFEKLSSFSELELREIRKHVLFSLNKVDGIIYQAIRRLKDDGISEDKQSFDAARSKKAALQDSKRLINEQLRILGIKDTPCSEAKLFMRFAAHQLPTETYASICDLVKQESQKNQSKVAK